MVPERKQMKSTLRTFIQHQLKCGYLLAFVIAMMTCLSGVADSRSDYVTAGDYKFLLVTPDKETGIDNQSGASAPFAMLNGIEVPQDGGYYEKPNFVILPDFVEKDSIRYAVWGFTNNFWSTEYQVREVQVNSQYYGLKLNNYPERICVLRQSPNDTGSLTVYLEEKTKYYNLTHMYPSYTGGSIGSMDLEYFPRLEYVMFPARDESCGFDYSNSYQGTSHLREVGFGFGCRYIYFDPRDRNNDHPELNTIKCASPVPPTLQGLDFESNPNLRQQITVHVPVGSYVAYANAEGWSNFENIVADIDYAYNYCYSWTIVDDVIYAYDYDEERNEARAVVIGPVDRGSSNSITIHDSVTINGETYPVTKIGECAFMGCKNIKEVDINAYNLKEIGDMAFYEYGMSTNNKIYYYANRLERIGHFAFYNCNGSFSGDADSFGPFGILKFIGNYAFSGACHNIYYHGYTPATLLLNEGLEFIGDYAFNGWHMKYSLAIPSTVSHIGEGAFQGGFMDNNNLQHIEFRNSSTNRSILNSKYGVFSHALKSDATFEYPESTVCVSVNDGINCKNVIIPKNVKYILPNSFSKQEIWLMGDTLPTIWSTSFSSSNNIAYVDFGVKIHTRKNLKFRNAEDMTIWDKFYNMQADIPDNEETYLNDGPWTFVINPETGKAIITGFDSSSILSYTSDDSLIIPDYLSSNGVDFEVESIRKWAISEVGKNSDGWYNLKKIILPTGLESLDDYAISYTDIWCVYSKASTPPEVESEYGFPLSYPFLEFSLKARPSLYVPEGTKELYKASKFGKMFSSIQEGSFSEIENITLGQTDEIDLIQSVDVFNLAGIRVYSGICSEAALPAGIYVVRQGEKTKKIIVK